MKRIEEFYYKLLSETPMNIPNSDEFYSDTTEAKRVYNEIISSPNEYDKVNTLSGQHPIDLYETRSKDNEIMCYFLPRNNDFIYGYVFYDLNPDGGIVTTSVYNDQSFVGLAYKVYKEYLLTRYKYIMSDKRHTDRGREFWRKIITFNPDKHISIWDIFYNEEVKQITHPNEVDEFYGDNENFERYRLKISNI